MSLIHPESCECAKSELDLFSVPFTQTSIKDSKWVEYLLLNSVSENRGPVEFLISGSGEEYVDLSETYLHIVAKITKPDGTDCTTSDDIGPVNLFLHSMFSQVETSLNERLVTSSSNTYAYRSYLEALLSYGESAKKSFLTASLWYKDTAGSMDSTSDNAGLMYRKRLSSESKSFSLIGRPHLDLCFQERLILNGVDIKIRFVRNKNDFCLMGDGKVVIENASLFVRKVKLAPAVQLAHIKALEIGTAKYPMRRVETKVFSAPKGNLTVNQENLFLGQLPQRVVVGCLETGAFNGKAELNPYNFKNFDIDFIAVYWDGKQVPTKPLKPDFENGLYARSYASLFSATGLMNTDQGNNISSSDYAKGYTLFGFDLSSDLSHGAHFHLLKTGSLRLEINFKNALPATINVIVYGEFQNIIEIDKARNVIVDYSA